MMVFCSADKSGSTRSSNGSSFGSTICGMQDGWEQLRSACLLVLYTVTVTELTATAGQKVC
jgi:hypothetical protein